MTSIGAPPQQIGPPTRHRYSRAGLSWWGAINTHPDFPPCAGCDRCCHLVVELGTGDAVPEEFVVEHDGVRWLGQRGDGACVALDPATLLCTIDADRLQTCRDFNRGENLCRQVLARHQAASLARANPVSCG